MADAEVKIEVKADNSDAKKKASETQKIFDDAGKRVGSALKAGCAVAVAAFAALGAYAFKSYADIEAGANAVKKATGATGDAANELVGVYEDVARSVVGSFEDIGAAVGEVNTRLGLNGDALEEASEAAMRFATVNGTDAVTSIQNVTRMMNAWNVDASEYSATMDMLTVAAQQTGIGVDALASSVQTQAATLGAMGFSMSESIALLASFEKSGVDTSRVLRGMRTATAAWTAEGKDSREEFSKFVQGVQDGTVTAADAIDLFGSMSGQMMYDAAQSGKLNYEELWDAIANGSAGATEAMYYDTLTIQDKLDLLNQNVQLAFGGLVEPVVDAMNGLLDTVVEMCGDDASIGQIAQGLYQLICDAVVNAANSLTTDDVVSFLDNIGSRIIGAADGNEQLATAAGRIGATLVNGIAQYLALHGGELVNAVVDMVWNAADMAIASFLAGISGQEIAGHMLNQGRWQEYTVDSSGNVRMNAQGGIYNSAKVIGVGEAGPEAVIPLQGANMWPFADAIASRIGRGSEAASLGDIGAAVSSGISGMGVYIDGRTLVGAIVGDVSAQQGRMARIGGIA